MIWAATFHNMRRIDEALSELQKMDPPRWRRRVQKNTGPEQWNIVIGQTWKRVRRSDLEEAA